MRSFFAFQSSRLRAFRLIACCVCCLFLVGCFELSWHIELQKDGSGTFTNTFITSPLYTMALRDALKRDAAKTGMTFREYIRDGQHHMSETFSFNSLSSLEQRINSLDPGDSSNRFTVRAGRDGESLIEHSIRVGSAKRDEALAFIAALAFRDKTFHYELVAPSREVEPNPARLGDLEVAASQTDKGAVWKVPMETLLAQGYQSLIISYATRLRLGVQDWNINNRAEAPPIPYEDEGACPFECCTYRRWLADKDTSIRSHRDEKAPVVSNVQKGEWVSATTGVVITTKPGKAKVLRAVTIDGVPARNGDFVYLLTYLGEGFYTTWYKGHEWEAGKKIGDADENIRMQQNLEIMNYPESTWWVQITNDTGQSGWSKEPNNFDNKDACGGDIEEHPAEPVCTAPDRTHNMYIPNPNCQQMWANHIYYLMHSRWFGAWYDWNSAQMNRALTEHQIGSKALTIAFAIHSVFTGSSAHLTPGQLMYVKTHLNLPKVLFALVPNNNIGVTFSKELADFIMTSLEVGVTGVVTPTPAFKKLVKLGWDTWALENQVKLVN